MIGASKNDAPKTFTPPKAVLHGSPPVTDDYGIPLWVGARVIATFPLSDLTADRVNRTTAARKAGTFKPGDDLNESMFEAGLRAGGYVTDGNLTISGTVIGDCSPALTLPHVPIFAPSHRRVMNIRRIPKVRPLPPDIAPMIIEAEDRYSFAVDLSDPDMWRAAVYRLALEVGVCADHSMNVTFIPNISFDEDTPPPQPVRSDRSLAADFGWSLICPERFTAAFDAVGRYRAHREHTGADGSHGGHLPAYMWPSTRLRSWLVDPKLPPIEALRAVFAEIRKAKEAANNQTRRST